MSAGDILFLIVLIPLLGGLHISAVAVNEKDFSNSVKFASVWTSAFAFLLSVILLFFPGENFSFCDISFSVNGVSVYMIASTTFLILIGVIIAFDEIETNLRLFYVPILFLESLAVMLFSTADILVFFILLELILVTAFVLLSVFSEDSVCASKFFIVLSVGAIFLFCGVIYLIETTGITEMNVLVKYTLTREQEFFIFAMFFIGFAHWTALFPLHIWLPDSYTKSPTAVSVIIAGTVSEIGVFGMLTILLPITKNINPFVRKYIFISAIISVAYATLAAITQRDIKRMTAYISIIYSAIIVIGIFSANVIGVTGAFFNITAHSFVICALSAVTRIIENHFGTRNKVTGAAFVLPHFSKPAAIPILSVISFPFLPCFVGNFLIISGNFPKHMFLSSILCFLIAGGVLYGVEIYHSIFFGESNQKKSKLSNIECAYLYPVILCTTIIGIIPDKIFCLAKDELLKICCGGPGS
jgi:NADH-quinone oxidoreductase subunit M